MYFARINTWRLLSCPQQIYNMITSSNGNLFRVTGPLCGEFISHRNCVDPVRNHNTLQDQYWFRLHKQNCSMCIILWYKIILTWMTIDSNGKEQWLFLNIRILFYGIKGVIQLYSIIVTSSALRHQQSSQDSSHPVAGKINEIYTDVCMIYHSMRRLKCQIEHTKTYLDILRNSFGNNGAIWRHKTSLAMVHVISYCVMAPSHNPSQCWLFCQLHPFNHI